MSVEVTRSKRLVSIVCPAFNEAQDIDELYARLRTVIEAHSSYSFEIIVIDNASTDGTQEKLRMIAKEDRDFRVIVNSRNFGHIRSPYHAMLQAQGDAVIILASDLQDPPELISAFLEEWERGYKVVMAVKTGSEEGSVFAWMRGSYYRTLNMISDVRLTNDATGFGLYDREVIEHIRRTGDPYPYWRGIVSELGYPISMIPFHKPGRRRGISKNNFYTLYDIAMLGMVSHSKVPLRIASFIGFTLGFLSLCAAMIFLMLKLMFWDQFPMGIAPLTIGLFFMFGMLFCFIGILGEYIASIHMYLQKRPVVVESERINFTPSRDPAANPAPDQSRAA